MLNFTLKQLRYVEAAGRLGSISRASKERSISQSSITAAIDSLEIELGYSLFVRTPAKGIQTTPSGLEALILIRSFIDQAKHFEGEVKSIGSDTTGALKIGCYATAAPAFLPPVLKTFTEKYPGISIKLLEGNMQTIKKFLEDGSADLTFTYEYVASNIADFIPLFIAPPFALISVDNPLAAQGSVSLEQLSEQPMVMLDLPNTRAYFTSLFQQLGLEPKIAHSTRSSEIARALVSGGFGYTILNIRPTDYVAGKSGYVALPISDALQAQSFGLDTLSTVYRPRIVEAFVNHCIALRDSGVFDSMVVR
ncbi:MAG: LysR family transcriptional regulator [Rhodobacteraceae bacterium]|nr:LysR family transcriptional regulator [Paracoccaceae bacterium]